MIWIFLLIFFKKVWGFFLKELKEVKKLKDKSRILKIAIIERMKKRGTN